MVCSALEQIKSYESYEITFLVTVTWPLQVGFFSS